MGIGPLTKDDKLVGLGVDMQKWVSFDVYLPRDQFYKRSAELLNDIRDGYRTGPAFLRELVQLKTRILVIQPISDWLYDITGQCPISPGEKEYVGDIVHIAKVEMRKYYASQFKLAWHGVNGLELEYHEPYDIPISVR